MVKGISAINNLTKAGIISALLMGSTALYASNPMKKDVQPNQTEVISKAGAEALKATNLQGLQQASVPTVHNPRIDATFRKYATNEEEKKQINSLIDGMYMHKGTFLASAQIQHELDRQQLFLLLEEKGNLLTENDINPKLGEKIKRFGSDFYKSVRPNAKKVDEWLDKDYSPKLLGLLSFDHKPTDEEVIKRLDDIAENKANFTKDDFLEYLNSSAIFKKVKNINSKSNDILKSELIAYKIFIIDTVIFKKILTNNNFFGEDSKFGKYEKLSYFYNDWMNSVSPDNN